MGSRACVPRRTRGLEKEHLLNNHKLGFQRSLTALVHPELQRAHRTCSSLLAVGAMAWVAFSLAVVAPANATSGVASFSGGVATTAGQRYGGLANTTIGWSFTVGAQNITVSALGFFDQDGDGLNTAHEVAIWTTAGSLLGSETVQSGTASNLVNGFRFEPLGSALVLLAGQSYVVGSHITLSSSDVFWAGTTATYAPEITYGTGRDIDQPFNQGFAFPSRTRADITGGFFGPNFELDGSVVGVESDTWGAVKHLYR